MSLSSPDKSLTDGANLSVDSCTSGKEEDEVYKLTDALSSTDLQKEPTTVSFAGQGLRLDNVDDAQQVIDAILACKDLKTIMLDGNTIGIDAAKAIGKAFESKSTLVNALLKDMFTSRLKTEVPDAVRFMTSGIALSGASLYELDLSDNAFGPVGMNALEPFLTGHACKKLNILRLNNNGLGLGGGATLAKCIPSLTSLRILIVGRNRLCSSADNSSDSSVEIGKSLATLTTLEQLEMPQNGIGAQGIASLATAVEANTKLTVLNLNDNIMTVKGGKAVAKALIHNTNIEVINFGDCLLRAKGGLHILQALLGRDSGLGRLRDINLAGNELGGEKCVEKLLEFAKRSDKNPNMKLDLSCNAFGDAVVDRLKFAFNQESVDLVLSEDEGTADEEEEEDDVPSEEEKRHEDDSGHEEGNAVSSPAKEDSAREELDELANVLKNEDTNVDQLCELFVNVSIKSFNHADGSLDAKALKQTESILDSAKKRSSNSFETANALLAQMGLIKTEDSKLMSPKNVQKDLRGPFLALSNSASQLDKTEKDVLQLFLGNIPNKAADAAGKYKHKLMQSLF